MDINNEQISNQEKQIKNSLVTFIDFFNALIQMLLYITYRNN